MSSKAEYNFSRALIELARERDLLQPVRETAAALLPVFDVPEVRFFISHPLVAKDDKKDLFRRLLPEETTREFKNFISLAIDRGLAKLLPLIIKRVIDMAIEAQGFEIVTLIAARPMSEGERETVLRQLEKRWSTKIFLRYRENPNLLGGVIIQRGDRLYDGSLTGQLNQLRQFLVDDFPEPDKEGNSNAFTD